MGGGQVNSELLTPRSLYSGDFIASPGWSRNGNRMNEIVQESGQNQQASNIGRKSEDIIKDEIVKRHCDLFTDDGNIISRNESVCYTCYKQNKQHEV